MILRGRLSQNFVARFYSLLMYSVNLILAEKIHFGSVANVCVICVCVCVFACAVGVRENTDRFHNRFSLFHLISFYFTRFFSLAHSFSRSQNLSSQLFVSSCVRARAHACACECHLLETSVQRSLSIVS